MTGQKLDVRTKLIIVLYSTVVVFALHSFLLEASMILFISIIYIAYKSKAFLKYAAVYAIAAVVQFYVLPHLSGMAMMTVSVFAVSFRRLLPCVMSGSLFIATTTASELTYGLQKMKIPQTITIPLAVTLRYIPAVKEELMHIHDAKLVRKISKNKNILKRISKNLEYYYVPLLVSAARMSEEISIAAIARGIENPGKHSSVFSLKLRIQDYLVFVLLVIFTVSVALF